MLTAEQIENIFQNCLAYCDRYSGRVSHQGDNLSTQTLKILEFSLFLLIQMTNKAAKATQINTHWFPGFQQDKAGGGCLFLCDQLKMLSQAVLSPISQQDLIRDTEYPKKKKEEQEDSNSSPAGLSCVSKYIFLTVAVEEEERLMGLMVETDNLE